MTDFDPTPAELIYQAIPPLPTARPQGATVEDTEIVVTFATLEGLVEVWMKIEFADQLVSQLRGAVREARNPNRLLLQPG
jgi:hypothetical protein